MGIVCYCPKGHRVKVKDRFAGLTGLCPHCGAKFRIGPAATEPDEPAAPGLPLARFVPLEPAVVATLPRALPYGTDRAAVEAAARQADDPFATPAEQPAPAAPPQLLHPVLAEQPDIPWCIAYPGGTPSEPVDAETMQAWLGGGQAEGTELVWRADWADWRPVPEVFPEFFPAR